MGAGQVPLLLNWLKVELKSNGTNWTESILGQSQGEKALNPNR